MKKLLLILMLVISGCSTTRKTDALVSKFLLPVNVVAAYFSSVAIHEAGHACGGCLTGAYKSDIDVVPVKKQGKWHLGYTTNYYRPGTLSRSDEYITNSFGPAAQYLGHLGCRALLETDRVPRLLQPFIGWLDLFNVIGYYSHVFQGLIRIDEQSDLVKLDPWVSWVMLGGGLAIDILDIIFIDDDFSKRFKVLFGEDFYEAKEDRQISLITTPGFFGIRLEW